MPSEAKKQLEVCWILRGGCLRIQWIAQLPENFNDGHAESTIAQPERKAA
ncbi:MAG: hypothetical protein JOZ83_15555 [Silvibacterium sp.]|nr:hypothetical protein [Silvibacterium sp.]